MIQAERIVQAAEKLVKKAKGKLSLVKELPKFNFSIEEIEVRCH